MAKKRKKAKKKSKSRKKGNGMEVVTTSSIKFAPMPKRGSKYDKIFAKVAKLRAGQSVIVPVPKGVVASVYHNRLNAALRKRSDIKVPKGCEYQKRTTTAGKVAICCVRL